MFLSVQFFEERTLLCSCDMLKNPRGLQDAESQKPELTTDWQPTPSLLFMQQAVGGEQIKECQKSPLLH